MKNCKNMSMLLSASIDGELSSAEEGMVKNHLKECGACNKEYRKLKELDSLFVKTSVPDLPPFFETRLLSRIREEEAGMSILDEIGFLNRKAIAACFSVILLVGGVYLSGIFLPGNSSDLNAVEGYLTEKILSEGEKSVIMDKNISENSMVSFAVYRD